MTDEQLGGLGHEVDAGEDDDVGLHIHGFTGQPEAVADDVSNSVENLRRLIIVRQNDRIASSLQSHDRVDILREGRPFDRGDRVPHFLVDRTAAVPSSAS